MLNLKYITILCIFVFSVSANNLRPGYDPLPRLQELKGKSDFSKNLVSTLELHLTSGGKIDEVITYVKEAIQGTENDQVKLQTEFIREMDRYDTEIEGMELDLSKMRTELDATVIQISGLIVDIGNLEIQEAFIENEILQLQDRENNVRSARDNDISAYSTRQNRDKKAITALNEIIPQLNDLLLGGSSLVQRTQEELQEYLRVKDVSDPVRSLVQMSMKFNKAKLSTVITKLENILEAIEAAKEIDEQNEEESKQRFDNLIAEIERIRASKNRELQTVKGELSTKNSALISARGSKDRLELNIESTETLKAQTEATQEQARESYTRRLNEAASAIQALNDALDILENNKDSLSSQEQAADEDIAVE